MDADITSPAYHVWQPVCRRDGADLHCAFDVTSPEGNGLGSGDARLFSGLLAGLDVCDGKPVSWRLRRFVSPFYAYDPASADVAEAFGVAWRVELLVGEATRYRPCGRFGPYPVHGPDPTWTGGMDILAGPRERCVLIALDSFGRDFDLLPPDTVGQVEVLRCAYRHVQVRQGRLDLGEIDLVDSLPLVQGALHQAAIRLQVAYRDDAQEREAWQDPPDWVALP